MTQLGLTLKPRQDDAQADNIKRVSERISGYVLAFCRWRRETRPVFYMQELTEYVHDRDRGAAPDSAGRILRNLRQKGLVSYQVLSRAESLYVVDWIRG